MFPWLGFYSSPSQGSESTLIYRVVPLIPPHLPLSCLNRCLEGQGASLREGLQEEGHSVVPVPVDLCYWVPSPAASPKYRSKNLIKLSLCSVSCCWSRRARGGTAAGAASAPKILRLPPNKQQMPPSPHCVLSPTRRTCPPQPGG